MEKVYNPQAIETKWYAFWESNDQFKPSGQGDPYCIMLPPPNVTGSLHMGHAFQDTIMDTLIRYHRMSGYNTLWQPGTDHAGIATQMVVERQLLQKETSRYDLGREAFVEKIWEWKAESGNTIQNQMKRLGASCDWSKERFTMDDGLSDAVKEVFVKLYEEDLIYKGKRLVNWDPKLKTAVSDLEVISQEEQGHMWHIRYPLANSDQSITVATTRPETMLGDMAVAVHPEDQRYKSLIGQNIALPLTQRLIPIIADDYVDPDFGTGCVKITPAHDFNDYEMGKRHQLEPLNILDHDAHLNEHVPLAYQGLERFAARKKVLADLLEQELLVKEEPHTLKIPRGDRSGVIVEPLLTDQWFVKAKPLAQKAIEAVESGDIKFVPENWQKTYYEWMNNIQDWCISRQLWWGHQIPAWSDLDGKIYVATSEQEARAKYDIGGNVVLTQDEDVLDTWFSSALWPFSTLGWPQESSELAQFYPTSVLVTGFDIIFFWVARMVMMGYKFTGKRPFHTVFVHGLIQDPEGQKMSKSKGNVIDPLDLIDGIKLEDLVKKRTTGLMQPEVAKKIDKLTRRQFPEGIPSFGTDAVRFTFLALATTGRHIRFDLHRVEGYRNFCNKIWNATRYVLMNVEDKALGQSQEERELGLADRWIFSQLQVLKLNAKKHIENYRFDLLATCLYEFMWHDYCDWYLELSKPILNNESSTTKAIQGTRYTLISVLEEVMRIMHPMMPYLTEEIWQKIAPMVSKVKDNDSIMTSAYPQYDESKVSQKATQSLEWIKTFISGIRNIRGEMNIAPSKMMSCLFHGGSIEENDVLHENKDWIQALAKLETLEPVVDKDSIPDSATQLAGDMELFIPLKGLVDVDQESKRLTKEIEKLTKEKKKSESKLENERYVSNAPPEIVELEKQRLSEFSLSIERLSAQLTKLEAL